MQRFDQITREFYFSFKCIILVINIEVQEQKISSLIIIANLTSIQNKSIEEYQYSSLVI